MVVCLPDTSKRPTAECYYNELPFMNKRIGQIPTGSPLQGNALHEMAPNQDDAVIVPRDRHRISRSRISENALKVLYRLHNAGYEAYLVGGGVRDLSLGVEPKDFDVATDARPEEVRELFRNCRLIGRRFRLAHVHFGPEIIEVATFRALHDPEEANESDADVEYDNGRIVRDNVYGTLEEDALRRDFSINALYYNIADYSVVDHCGGLQDLEDRVLRLIGDPVQRYREDPVRMLRAVRFAAKMDFEIAPETGEPIAGLAPSVGEMPPARLFDEVLKMFMGGAGQRSFGLLRRYGLFEPLFPWTAEALNEDPDGVWVPFLESALASTDRRVAENKPVTPAFLFAALLWPAVRLAEEDLLESGKPPMEALQTAATDVQRAQQDRVALPKRFGIPMKEIWTLQPRFARQSGKRAERLLGHPRFRAAYDFLELRAANRDAPPEWAAWWRDYQARPEAERARARTRPPGRSRRRRGGGGRPTRRSEENTSPTTE